MFLSEEVRSSASSVRRLFSWMRRRTRGFRTIVRALLSSAARCLTRKSSTQPSRATTKKIKTRRDDAACRGLCVLLSVTDAPLPPWELRLALEIFHVQWWQHASIKLEQARSSAHTRIGAHFSLVSCIADFARQWAAFFCSVILLGRQKQETEKRKKRDGCQQPGLPVLTADVLRLTKRPATMLPVHMRAGKAAQLLNDRQVAARLLPPL